MRLTPRTAAAAAFAAVACDLLVAIVSGGAGIFIPGAMGRGGFALRLLLLGALGASLWFRSRATLVLGLCMLPSLYQFQYAGGRINGDGIMYYPYVRSLWKDFDLDFTNEYEHYGLLERGDLRVPTKTGLRRSIFSIGPALVWSPFFLAGEAVARVQATGGAPVDLSGYGPHHRNAVALGSFALGFAALLLIRATLQRHFTAGIALGTTVLVWGATFLHWYMVQQPTMSHAPSAFAASLVIFLWDRDKSERSGARWLWLGLALGLAMCIRWQNGVLLILPAIDLASAACRKQRSWQELCAASVLLVAGVLVAAFPQLAAWHTLYGEWLLRNPPHGPDFLRLTHPFFWETLFSSRHGLLSWTPVFWAGYLGMALLLGQRNRTAVVLAVPLVLMTYVNFCSGDWWAGGSFSNRRFDSLLPILAFGIAAAAAFAVRAIRRRPSLAAAAVAVAAVAWNGALMAQVRRGLVPRDDTVSFANLAGGSAEAVEDAVGFPTTWPASWLFAARHDVPPGQFDAVVGKYMFYRQGNLEGRVEVGGEAHRGLLDSGFARSEARDGRACRRLLRDGRIFTPLDVAEGFDVVLNVHAEAAGSLAVAVNGQPAGSALLTPGWNSPAVAAPATLFRDGVNEVTLGSDAQQACVASLELRRVQPR